MNGYTYAYELENEEDVRKIYHYVITPTGERKHIHWSSYEEMSDDDFKLWIHLGMPTKPLKGSNFNHKSLIEYLNHNITA